MDQEKCQPYVHPKTQRCLSGYNWKTFRSQAIEASKTVTASSKKNSQRKQKHKNQAYGNRRVSQNRGHKPYERKANDLPRRMLSEQEKQIQNNIQHGIVKNPHEMAVTKHIAMDCEMVGIGDGSENMIARVSIVNKYGYCIYDKYVKPREHIKDYRSAVSGIYPHHLENGTDFQTVQREVAEILKGKTLVGHAIKHDLDVLFLSHPRKSIRDTSVYKPFRQVSKGNTPSLKKLSQVLLGREIQTGEHNSIEDARATMQLYMLYKSMWESEISYRQK